MCHAARQAIAALAVTLLFALRAAAQDANQPDSEHIAEDERSTAKNLVQLMRAMQNYHDAKKTFPPAYMSEDGKPTLSWRVAILPYLEAPDGNKAYTELHLNEPWDSVHNKPFVAGMPKVYQSPASKLRDGRTVYLAPRGPATAFPGDKGVAMRKISDGTTNTIAVLEVDDKYAVPWTKPEDWTFDRSQPKAGLGGQFANRFHAAFLDGSVHVLKNQTDDKTMNALFTIAGREVLTPFD